MKARKKDERTAKSNLSVNLFDPVFPAWPSLVVVGKDFRGVDLDLSRKDSVTRVNLSYYAYHIGSLPHSHSE